MPTNKNRRRPRNNASTARRTWPEDFDPITGVDPFTSRWITPPCSHWREPVEIAQATIVHASAFFDRPSAGAWRWPEVGVYFSEAWAGAAGISSSAWAGPAVGPRSEIAVLAWRDGEAPRLEETERVLAYALDAAEAGRFVDIGCLAGHGRTGTALAALMILAGDSAKRSIARVRRDYCALAIETLAQERYLFDLATRLRNARTR